MAYILFQEHVNRKQSYCRIDIVEKGNIVQNGKIWELVETDKTLNDALTYKFSQIPFIV